MYFCMYICLYACMFAGMCMCYAYMSEYVKILYRSFCACMHEAYFSMFNIALANNTIVLANNTTCKMYVYLCGSMYTSRYPMSICVSMSVCKLRSMYVYHLPNGHIDPEDV